MNAYHTANCIQAATFRELLVDPTNDYDACEFDARENLGSADAHMYCTCEA